MSSAGNLPPDESDESDNENDPTSDEAILRLFNSDTEGDDFSGFSAQEEEDTMTFLVGYCFIFVTSRVSFKGCVKFICFNVPVGTCGL